MRADQPVDYVGAIAGVLLICDGVSCHRATALLTASTFSSSSRRSAPIVDRDQVRERMHTLCWPAADAATVWIAVGVRWYGGSGAGVLLLACSHRGPAYFVLFFGAMVLAFDVAARRQYQVQRPWLDSGVTLPSGYALG